MKLLIEIALQVRANLRIADLNYLAVQLGSQINDEAAVRTAVLNFKFSIK